MGDLYPFVLHFCCRLACRSGKHQAAPSRRAVYRIAHFDATQPNFAAPRWFPMPVCLSATGAGRACARICVDSATAPRNVRPEHLPCGQLGELSYILTQASGLPSRKREGVMGTIAVCFLRGTRIWTPGGESRVEDLRINDLVVTASGEAKPIQWVWRRRFERRSD